MGVYGGPNIVTDGLTMYFDAGNTKSYTRTSNNLYDLTYNGNNGIISGATYNNNNLGSFFFNGFSNYIDTGYNEQFNDFSVCAWFMSSGITSYSRIIDKSYLLGFWIGRNALNPNKWGGGVKLTTLPYGIFLTLTDEYWHFISLVRSGTTMTIYGDGITNTISTTVPSGSIDTTKISIGATINDGGAKRDWFCGNIPIIKIYNKALSSDQIFQNFNAFRGRYGL